MFKIVTFSLDADNFDIQINHGLLSCHKAPKYSVLIEEVISVAYNRIDVDSWCTYYNQIWMYGVLQLYFAKRKNKKQISFLNPLLLNV